MALSLFTDEEANRPRKFELAISLLRHSYKSLNPIISSTTVFICRGFFFLVHFFEVEDKKSSCQGILHPLLTRQRSLPVR